MRIYYKRRYINKNGNSSEIKRIVDNPEWQSIRKSFLGTWKETPAKNISRLRKYLGEKPWTSHDKLRRVVNYLTGSGFRTKQITHPSIDSLLSEAKSALEKVRTQL